MAVHGYERFGIAHDRGASAGQSRRFSVQSQREPRDTPLAVEALGLWRELEKHTERELLRQTGGVILGPDGSPEILSAVASADRGPSATGVPVWPAPASAGIWARPLVWAPAA